MREFIRSIEERLNNKETTRRFFCILAFAYFLVGVSDLYYQHYVPAIFLFVIGSFFIYASRWI